MGSYKAVKEQGYTFVFKYDGDDSEILHIFARHLTTIDDALDVFFSADPVWKAEYERYESYSPTHGLYWFWHDQDRKVVMVISCFRILEA